MTLLTLIWTVTMQWNLLMKASTSVSMMSRPVVRALTCTQCNHCWESRLACLRWPLRRRWKSWKQITNLKYRCQAKSLWKSKSTLRNYLRTFKTKLINLKQLSDVTVPKANDYTKGSQTCHWLWRRRTQQRLLICHSSRSTHTKWSRLVKITLKPSK